jgi:site-specific recombinase XerD
MSDTPQRSYARANRELINAFERYSIARGMSPNTIRAYVDSATRLADLLGSRSFGEAKLGTIRELLVDLDEKGLGSSSLRLHTAALRSFFKFVSLTGLTSRDPTLLLRQRKIPRPLQRVMTVEEVERLIGTARDPLERAVPEVLYSTGVRVSELVSLRLEDIMWGVEGTQLSSVRVRGGKGNKDRTVLFGEKAAAAIREYQKWRPSQRGFLFEAPGRNGHICRQDMSWQAHVYVNGTKHNFSIGSVAEIPTLEQAREIFELLASKIPGYYAVPRRPYCPVAIRDVLHRLAHRAGLGRVHPHALRRAMACHMLKGGGDTLDGGKLRAIQDLLGHTNLSTTMIYTHLTTEELAKVHEKFHPHGQKKGDADEHKE